MSESSHRVYHRMIRLVADGALVTGDLADDAHHFRVHLKHDGATVREIQSEAVRYPWTTCPEATRPLEDLVGMPLSDDCTSVGEHTDPRSQCTHIFDLAGLAVAHAASGRAQRLYHVSVGGPFEDQFATLDRDGERLFEWRLAESTIHGPPPFNGISFYGGFMAWAKSNLPADLAEAAIVMRRGCMIASVRFIDLDQLSSAPQAQQVRGQCHTYTPGTAERALRVYGSRHDYTESPSTLLDLPTRGGA